MLLVAWWSCVCVVYRWCMRARACWRGYATSPCCYVWKAGPCGSAESTQVCAVLSTVGQETPRHRVPTAETKWRVTRMLFGKLFCILSMNLSSQHDHPEWMWSRSGWGKGRDKFANSINYSKRACRWRPTISVSYCTQNLCMRAAANRPCMFTFVTLELRTFFFFLESTGCQETYQHVVWHQRIDLCKTSTTQQIEFVTPKDPRAIWTRLMQQSTTDAYSWNVALSFYLWSALSRAL